MLSVLKGISIDILANAAAINTLHRDLLDVPFVKVQSFEKQYDITLPFNRLEEFDLKLKRDKAFNESFVRIFNLKQQITIFHLY